MNSENFKFIGLSMLEYRKALELKKSREVPFLEKIKKFLFGQKFLPAAFVVGRNFLGNFRCVGSMWSVRLLQKILRHRFVSATSKVSQKIHSIQLSVTSSEMRLISILRRSNSHPSPSQIMAVEGLGGGKKAQISLCMIVGLVGNYKSARPHKLGFQK